MYRLLALAAFAALLACALPPAARAIWVETQLTPQLLSHDGLKFEIDCHDIGGQKQFDVTITAEKDGKLSPVVTGLLVLSDGSGEQVTVPVKAEESRHRVAFWFRVPAKYLAHSRFTFGIHGYAAVPIRETREGADEWGRPGFVGLPGGKGYWFELGEFTNGAGQRSKVKGER